MQLYFILYVVYQSLKNKMDIIAVLTASNYVLINECAFLMLTICLAILVFMLYLAWSLNVIHGDTLVFGGLIFSLILGGHALITFRFFYARCRHYGYTRLLVCHFTF